MKDLLSNIKNVISAKWEKSLRIYLLIMFAFTILGVENATAQQVPLYSQYMMNGYLLNPAIAGAYGYTAISLTAREQWLNIPQAPKTHALSFDTRLLKNSFISSKRSIRKRRKSSARSGRVGLGGYIFNDKNGLIDRTGIQLTYAYHLRMKKAQLSFGLSGQGYQFTVDKEQFRPFSNDDQTLDNMDNAFFVPDANFGVYYVMEAFYAGLSINQLFESPFRLGDNSANRYEEMLRHYYLTAGYKIDINPRSRRKSNFSIEPSFLLKTNELLNTQLDINAKLYFDQKYWAGVSYRTGHAFAILGGFKYDKYYFGYAFDYPLSSIRRYNYGSHEFIITARFGDNARRYRWLERF